MLICQHIGLAHRTTDLHIEVHDRGCANLQGITYISSNNAHDTNGYFRTWVQVRVLGCQQVLYYVPEWMFRLKTSGNSLLLSGRHKTGAESFQRRFENNVWRQRVPYSDDCREERVPVHEYGRHWQVLFELVTSRVSDVRLEIHYR